MPKIKPICVSFGEKIMIKWKDRNEFNAITNRKINGEKEIRRKKKEKL